MSSPIRPSLGIAVSILSASFALGQPKIEAPKTPGPLPTVTLPTGQVNSPEAPPVTIQPGPEPWFTIFGTGEVVGYIEPCG